MEQILKNLIVPVNEGIYLKDPLSSDLGKKILHKSLVLIAELGMEHFTFKKLADQIGSTEAAIYRYFENKHRLLLYLSAWYWGWLEHHLVFSISNLNDPVEKMTIAIRLLVDGPEFKKNQYVDTVILKDIITEQFYKYFLTKEVDMEEKQGYFKQFYRLTDRITEIAKEINREYKYPKALVSTLMESALMHTYYLLHLPSMTEFTLNGNNRIEFYKQLIFNTLKYEE